MKKGKLKKFDDIHKMKNVLERGDFLLHFKIRRKIQKKPVIIELCCGGGEYALYLAKNNPLHYVIGIDIQGERLWYGATKAENKNISNVFFLRVFIDHLDKYFKIKSVDEIWITFPDPFPKKRHEKKRVTSPKFLDMYAKILKPGGKVHLKTDSELFFDYSVNNIKQKGFKICENIKDIYSQKHLPEILSHKTRFEKQHLVNKRKINYLNFNIT